MMKPVSPRLRHSVSPARALVRGLRSAVSLVSKLSAEDFAKAREQLLWIRNRAKNVGWGFCDDVDALTATFVASNGTPPAKSRRPQSNSRMEPAAGT